jgi:signal transduction histidine kinase
MQISSCRLVSRVLWDRRGEVLERVDVRVALVALLEVVALVSNGPWIGTAGGWAAQGTGLALAFAGLAVQRSRPGPGLMLAFAGAVAMPLDAASIWPLLAGLLEAGLQLRLSRVLGWTAAACLALCLQRTVWSLGVGGFGVELVALGLAPSVGLMLAGRTTVRRERLVRAEEREHLEAERALAEERAAIARDVHDVVGRSLTMIVMHARLLAERSTDDQARAEAGLIAEHGREAVGELGRTVRLIRGDAPRLPETTIPDFQPVIEQVRTAGLDVSLTVEGTPRPLTGALAQATVRVVQEALTNCIRHAPSATMSVVVRYTADEIELRIADDGPASADWLPVTGMGLTGMQERVALHGGRFAARPMSPHGFQVQATFPTPEHYVG